MFNVTDPRTERALEIASNAGQFARCRTRDGELVWAIPSQSREHVRYLVTETACQCADFHRNGLRSDRIGFYGAHFTCKHVRALKILLSAWTAQQTEQDADLVLVGDVFGLHTEPRASLPTLQVVAEPCSNCCFSKHLRYGIP